MLMFFCQALLNGEVDIAMTWNGLVYAAMQENPDIAMSCASKFLIHWKKRRLRREATATRRKKSKSAKGELIFYSLLLILPLTQILVFYFGVNFQSKIEAPRWKFLET